jgi:hypothetical protein
MFLIKNGLKTVLFCDQRHNKADVASITQGRLYFPEFQNFASTYFMRLGETGTVLVWKNPATSGDWTPTTLLVVRHTNHWATSALSFTLIALYFSTFISSFFLRLSATHGVHVFIKHI